MISLSHNKLFICNFSFGVPISFFVPSRVASVANSNTHVEGMVDVESPGDGGLAGVVPIY